MALHKDFPKDKFAILEPEIRWFPADEALREQGYEKLLPPFVPELRKRAKEWRDNTPVAQSAHFLKLKIALDAGIDKRRINCKFEVTLSRLK